jgi:PAS domain S-box-containing protein
MKTEQSQDIIESTDRFFENSPLGYLVLDKLGVILDVNEKLCQLLNYNKSEMVSIHLLGFVYLEDQPKYEADYLSFFQKPEGIKLKLRLLQKDDTLFYAELVGSKDVIPISNGKNREVLLVNVIDNTKEHEQNQEIISNKKRFEVLFDQSAVGIAVVKLDGTIIELNERFAKIIGYKQEELTGKDFREITYEEDIKLDEQYISEIIAGERISFELEKRYIHKDGHLVWIRLYSNIVRDNFGDPQYAIASITDISQAKQREEQLALSEHKFRFYLENTPNGIFTIDEQGDYLEVNKAFCEITGYSEPELLEMGLPDIMHPSSIKQELEQFDNLNKESTSSSLITFIRKDGEKRVWNEIGKKLADGRYIAFTQDVTEQIKGQKELKRNEQLLKFAIEQMPIAVMMTGVQGTSNPLFNQLAYDLVNFKPNAVGEMILPGNRKILPILNPDRSQIDVKDMPLSKALSQGISTHRQDMIIPHPEGDRWISASAEPLKDEQGNVIAGIVVFPEITARKELETRLRVNQRLLNEVEKLARIGGWEIDVITGKATWTKGTFDIVEIPYGDDVPGMYEHVDYYLAEYREMINQRMADLINNDTPLEYEAEFVTEQGNIRWGKVVGLREMKDGKCMRIYGTFQDITQQKELEKEILGKTAQMESILNNTNDFILLGDKDGKSVYFNSAYRQVMKAAIGLKVEQGDSLQTHLPSEKETAYWEDMHNRVLGGESFMAQYSLPYLDGKVHYLELSYSPVIENGEISGFSEITRDITERKLFEMEVIESEEKYRILAETLQNIIITHDLQGKILYINQYGIDYVGKTREELLGSSIDQILPHKDQIERVQIIDKMVKSGELDHLTAEIEFIKAEGEKRILEYGTSPILKEQKISGMLIIARDVTERQKTETELANHREHLEQLVNERTAKLEEQKAELERFNKLFVGREFRIKELRDKVKELKKELVSHGVKVEDSNEFFS